MKWFGTALSALALVSGATAQAEVGFDWVMVGDAGNAVDPLNAAQVSGIGSVSYAYRIATREVNLIQYTEFLNAVDPNGLNALELYFYDLETNSNVAGILLTGAAPEGSKYSVIGGGLRPVSYVSWKAAARFVNWMENGQGAGGTESGVYDMSLETPVRSGSASYFLPTENEWYKAAYYDPTKDGVGGYWFYPTRSDDAPGNVIGSDANQANYKPENFGSPRLYSVTQSSSYSSSQNYLADGGAYRDSASFYGTYDQGGSVWEWNETVIGSSSRGVRGGSWEGEEVGLQSTERSANSPGAQFDFLGFRIASVPEPSSALLVLVAGSVWLGMRCRSKMR